MLRETPRAASGAPLIDLHAVRAGLSGGAAALDQQEGLRRQAAGRPDLTGPQDLRALAVGDQVRDNATGEVGTVIECDAERALLQFAGRRYMARRAEIAPDLVALPCDCEAAS